jgi:acetyl esterase/lipase
MDKLDPRVAAFFGTLGALGPPPDVVPGDPTKPATPEERVYWQKQSDYVGAMVANMGDTKTISEQVNKYGNELFTFPASTTSSESNGASYQIEARFFRAQQQQPPTSSSAPPPPPSPPLIVWFHGGGMTALHRDAVIEMNTCITLCQMGCSVLTPEFRNAREYHFPAGVDDCVDTVLWAKANQDKLGVNNILITAGCSGGGNLAIATFIRALERGVNVQTLIQGIYSDAPNIRPKYTGVERITKHVEFAPFTPPNVLDDLVNNYTQSESDYKNPSAFPLLATDEILVQFPPTMLHGEEFDTLREDAKELYERLATLRVPGCSYEESKNMVHGQFFMPLLNDKVTSTLLIGQIAGFVKALQFVSTATSLQ